MDSDWEWSEGTQRNIQWLQNLWNRWISSQQTGLTETDGSRFKLSNDISDLKVFFTNSKTFINDHLLKFFKQIRKNDGSEFPSKTLRAMLFLMQMLVKELDLGYSIHDDLEFDDTREYIARLRETAIKEGTESERTVALITDEMDKELFEKGVLGDSDPVKLLKTVYYLVAKVFGVRSREEHRYLQAGLNSQIKIYGEAPFEKMTYTERLFNKTGGLNHHQPKNVTIFAANYHDPKSCPVRLLKFYMSLLPPVAESFYCQPAELREQHKGKWFSSKPVGKNALAAIMRNIADEAGWDTSLVWTATSACGTSNTRKISKRHAEKSFQNLFNGNPHYTESSPFLLNPDNNDVIELPGQGQVATGALAAADATHEWVKKIRLERPPSDAILESILDSQPMRSPPVEPISSMSAIPSKRPLFSYLRSNEFKATSPEVPTKRLLMPQCFSSTLNERLQGEIRNSNPKSTEFNEINSTGYAIEKLTDKSISGFERNDLADTCDVDHVNGLTVEEPSDIKAALSASNAKETMPTQFSSVTLKKMNECTVNFEGNPYNGCFFNGTKHPSPNSNSSQNQTLFDYSTVPNKEQLKLPNIIIHEMNNCIVNFNFK